jgi:hypothetical protein
MIRRFISWLFTVPSEEVNIGSVIRWWEIRRIPYNIVIGCVGIISLMLFFYFIDRSHVLKPGEDAEEPLAIIAAPFIMNLCYTFGWIVECGLRLTHLSKNRKAGLLMFKAGCGFSVFVALLPSAYWSVYYFTHVAFAGH